MVDVDHAARVFTALADPARLRVLAVLADAQRCVCEIQAGAPMPANLLSYHLRTLREAGLVVGHRRGRFIDYRVTDDAAALVRGALHVAGLAPPPIRPTAAPPSVRCLSDDTTDVAASQEVAIPRGMVRL